MSVQVKRFTGATDQQDRSAKLALGCLCRMVIHLHLLRLQADVGRGGEIVLQDMIPQAAQVTLLGPVRGQNLRIPLLIRWSIQVPPGPDVQTTLSPWNVEFLASETRDKWFQVSRISSMPFDS